jgi:protein-S-isoprenylcysteine O-methyltransferase Ste14
MKSSGQLTRFGGLLILGLGAAEVLIMVSPFAGFFYAGARFESLLGFLSASSMTAWLDGFFLNHSVVTTSTLLEWQREIGLYVFALGLWGFLISAFQVYGNKIARRGVAKGLLYRISRHPQYLSLGIAGAGLLTIWPRFLLLGCWVTMLFLYAALARFEEHRMEERFGDSYRSYMQSRPAFLPGSPVRRLFEATFGRLQPRALGWALAYVSCLALAFSSGFVLRTYTRASTTVLFQPEQQTVTLSTWPQSQEWMAKVLETARANEEVQHRLQQAQGNKPVVATILAPRYVMKGMFYKVRQIDFLDGMRITARFLVPGGFRLKHFMGVDPDTSSEPVEVVFSRAEKPYKDDLALEEALDASVRLTPLVVADVIPTTGEVARVRIPAPQNAWGPKVKMPLF